MSVIIQRVQCAQIPHVTILGVGSNPVIYVAHMQQIIGQLLQKLSTKAANHAMHAFLKSEAGRSMQQGGDLVSAYLKGPLNARIYNHQLGTDPSKLSYFVTMEGARDVVNLLPNQDDSVKQKLLSLLRDHLLDQAKVTSCFLPASEDQMDEEEGGNTDDCGDLDFAMTPYHARISAYRLAADNRALVAQLQAKDIVIKAETQAKEAIIHAKETLIEAKDEVIKAKEAEAAAEIAKERAEKEAAKKELQLVMESAAKDAKIMELQMKLMGGSNLMMSSATENHTTNHTEGVSIFEPKKRTRFDDSDDEENLAVGRHSIGSKSNWIIAYEADDALSTVEMTKLFPGLRACWTAKMGGKWVCLLRLFKRKRFSFFYHAFLPAKTITKLWIQARDKGDDDDFLYIPELKDKTENEKKIKHYMLQSPIVKEDDPHALFPLLAVFARKKPIS